MSTDDSVAAASSDEDGDARERPKRPAPAGLAMPIEKRDFLFRFVPSPLRSRLRLDQEALYSTTDQLTADKITKDLQRFVPRGGRVADATACIGGNTYSFAQNFAAVDAYELDRRRAEYLEHNLGVLGVTNVRVVHGDVLKRIQGRYDAIMIDPQWGGPGYKQLTDVRLTLSGKPLDAVCFQLTNHAKYIAVKTPTNFAEAAFLADTAPFMTLVHKNTHLRKMVLLIFEVL